AVKEEAVGLRTIAPADDIDVARAAGDDKPGSCPRSFDQRVDGNGRAMDQLVDYSSGESALADAIDDPLLPLCWRGEALCLNEAAGGVVKSDQVGESSSNVDSDDDHADSPLVRHESDPEHAAARAIRGGWNVVRDCRIAPDIGRRQKISDSRAKGKDFRESAESGCGFPPPSCLSLLPPPHRPPI